MILVLLVRWVWDTTKSRPSRDMPNGIYRSSPNEWSGSGKVMARGSPMIVAACSKETPCFRLFEAAFLLSHANSMAELYHECSRGPKCVGWSEAANPTGRVKTASGGAHFGDPILRANSVWCPRNLQSWLTVFTHHMGINHCLTCNGSRVTRMRFLSTTDMDLSSTWTETVLNVLSNSSHISASE